MGKIDDALADMARARKDAQSVQSALQRAQQRVRELAAGYAELEADGDRARAARIQQRLGDVTAETSQLITHTDQMITTLELLKDGSGLIPGADFGTAPVPAQRAHTRPLWPADRHQVRGKVTDVPRHPEKARAISRENQSARVLAEHGYDILQNPTPRNGKEPDYLIQGEYWDCYAPRTAKASAIRKTMSGKVGEGQAERIVLNLDNSTVRPEALEAILHRCRINGLREVKIVKGGTLIDFYP